MDSEILVHIIDQAHLVMASGKPIILLRNLIRLHQWKTYQRPSPVEKFDTFFVKCVKKMEQAFITVETTGEDEAPLWLKLPN